MHEKETEKARKLSVGTNERPPYWKIFKQAFPQLFNIFFVFFITLAVFPAVQSGRFNCVSTYLKTAMIKEKWFFTYFIDIKQLDSNFLVPEKFYISILCFLTFNASAMFGSLTTSWVQWVCSFNSCNNSSTIDDKFNACFTYICSQKGSTLCGRSSCVQYLYHCF